MTHDEKMFAPRLASRTGQRTWAKPMLHRIQAGSAEVGSNPVRPEGQIAMGQS